MCYPSLILEVLHYYFQNDSLQVSFHLPLHRYLAVFLCQAVAKQDITLNEVLPSTDSFLNLLMMHPLRVQVSAFRFSCRNRPHLLKLYR